MFSIRAYGVVYLFMAVTGGWDNAIFEAVVNREANEIIKGVAATALTTGLALAWICASQLKDLTHSSNARMFVSFLVFMAVRLPFEAVEMWLALSR